MTITEFLLAQIAKDEAYWRDGEGRYARDCQECAALSDHEPDRPTVDRMLADCAAKRRIVDLHGRVGHPLNRKRNPFTGELEADSFVCDECSGVDDPYVDQVEYPCETLRILASVYADHDDCRDEWRSSTA